MKKDGKKISDKFENPIDILFIRICEKLNTIWFKLKLIPNHLTLFSLLLALIAIHFIYKDYFTIGAILYLMAYFFDCADGNYARKYNMVTKFGDFFEHISDLLKIVLLFIYIYNSDIKYNYKIIFLIIFIFIGIITGIQIGCQEKIYDKSENITDSSFLTIFKKMCFDTKYIHITKYLSCGTLQMFFFIFIILIPYLKK